MFTRRHYAFIAKVVGESCATESDDVYDRMVRSFVEAFEQDNPRFERGPFYYAANEARKQFTQHDRFDERRTFGEPDPE